MSARPVVVVYEEVEACACGMPFSGSIWKLNTGDQRAFCSRQCAVWADRNNDLREQLDQATARIIEMREQVLHHVQFRPGGPIGLARQAVIEAAHAYKLDGVRLAQVDPFEQKLLDAVQHHEDVVAQERAKVLS